MNNISLTEQQKLILGNQHKIAIDAFDLVCVYDNTGDVKIEKHNIVFANNVYRVFSDSIEETVREASELPAHFYGWTPATTHPKELMGMILEVSLATGLLNAWEADYRGTIYTPNPDVEEDEEIFDDVFSSHSTVSYAKIQNRLSDLANSGSSNIGMKLLHGIRERYQLPHIIGTRN